jgi:hypothetical protein
MLKYVGTIQPVTRISPNRESFDNIPIPHIFGKNDFVVSFIKIADNRQILDEKRGRHIKIDPLFRGLGATSIVYVYW